MLMNQKNLTLPNALSPVVQEIRTVLETVRCLAPKKGF